MTVTSLHSGFDIRGFRNQAEGGVVVFGTLDETIAPILDRTLRRIQLSRLTRFVIDLAALESIDTAGLALLESFEMRCAKAGCALELITGEGPVAVLLDAAGRGGAYATRPPTAQREGEFYGP